MSPTDYVVVSAIVLLSIWEVYTLVNTKPNDTISETVWRASATRPIVPFLAGLLCGHFFWKGTL